MLNKVVFDVKAQETHVQEEIVIDVQFGYPIFVGFFTRDNLVKWGYRLHHLKAYSKTFVMIGGTVPKFPWLERNEVFFILYQSRGEVTICIGPKFG